MRFLEETQEQCRPWQAAVMDQADEFLNPWETWVSSWLLS